MTGTAVQARIEPLAWWDITAVAELERQLFAGDSPWTPAMFWAELAAGNKYFAAKDAADAVIGYAGVAVGPDLAEVQTIGVAPQAQGGGVGRDLLRQLLSCAGALPVALEVRCDNAIAIGLYRSEGFETVRRRRGYYQPSGADAYVMLRPAGVRA